MNEIALGLDIGTSYTKAAACTIDGKVRALYRKPTPHVKINSAHDLHSATAWWECAKGVVRGLLAELHPPVIIKSICISAMTPTLTVFDAAHPDNAYAILYSSTASMESSKILQQYNPELAKRRLDVLRSISHTERFVSPHITDLVGYANWRLTGVLTINSICLAEMGLPQSELGADMLANEHGVCPRLVSPAEQIAQVAPHIKGLNARAKSSPARFLFQ